MKTNYVLIDYENVQPDDLTLLRNGPFKVKVFLGPHQAKKVATSLAIALQPFGDHAEYILLESPGPNALDFHIAYYIGALSSEEPAPFFHIISKDSGFDPLIAHLKSKGVLAHRSQRIADIPLLKPVPAPPSTIDAQIEVVVMHLARLKTSRPRTQKTLLSTIGAVFKKGLSEQQLANLFHSLRTRGVVKIEGTKVAYALPEPAAQTVQS